MFLAPTWSMSDVFHSGVRRHAALDDLTDGGKPGDLIGSGLSCIFSPSSSSPWKE